MASQAQTSSNSVSALQRSLKLPSPSRIEHHHSKHHSLSTLTCQTVLTPPLRTIGHGGADSLSFIDHSPAWHCCFSRDGAWLAVAYGAPTPCIRIWKHVKQPTPYEAFNTNDNSNNTYIDDAFSNWELQATLSGIQNRTIRHIAFAPISSPLVLASASFDGTVAIWEYDNSDDNNKNKEHSWDCIAQLEGHENEVKCVEWNATGSLLATCSRDKSVWIWECHLPGSIGSNDNYDDFECIAVLNSHEGDVKSIVFAPSHGQWGDADCDEILLSASYDDTVCVYAEEMGDWYCAATIKGVHSSTIWSLTVAPSGSRFISASADGSLAIYKFCSKNKEQKGSELLSTTTRTTATTIGNNSSSSGKAHWKCVGTLPSAHSGPVYSLHYAPARVGHGRLVSGGADGRIQIYRETPNSQSDRPIFTLEASAGTAKATSATKSVASNNDNGSSNTGNGSEVNCVCWHPINGSMLASATDDGNVRLWKYRS